MSELINQLQEELGPCQWADLAPHVARDAVILVHPSLELLIVGEAIAEDNTALVSQWLQHNFLRKPTLDELNLWSQNGDRLFQALIVQPFVLIHDDPPE